MLKKFTSYSQITLGFCTGLFISFLTTVLVFQEQLFDKPWDILWAGVFGVTGSLIGGISAFFIALAQLNSMVESEKKKNDEHQSMLSLMIKDQLEKNIAAVQFIKNTIPPPDGYEELSRLLIAEDKIMMNAIMLMSEKIDIEYLVHLRAELKGLKYLKLHSLIGNLIEIQKTINQLLTLKYDRLIHANLKSIVTQSETFLKNFNNHDWD
ncbi:hypothetical protein [Paenibacillus cymbidii]|uniref:hypothetical protein n=1 Tax=Paenibacillus cymbidii TaxID=1639034 RepID=UPI001081AB13|nr:hypothetical protein [Paenibacillus cymbidii]